MRKLSILFLAVSLFALFGCRKSARETPTARLESPVTAPISPLSASSPLAPPSEASSEPMFSFDEPLTVGATSVSGTGPAGTAIIIADVTLMAERLGAGVIQEDGTFSIPVDPPLIEGRLIGIQLGVAEGETAPSNPVQQLLPYKGDGARDVPQLGFFWDTAMVVPAP